MKSEAHIRTVIEIYKQNLKTTTTKKDKEKYEHFIAALEFVLRD